MKPKLSYKARVLILAYAIGIPLGLWTAGCTVGWW